MGNANSGVRLIPNDLNSINSDLTPTVAKSA